MKKILNSFKTDLKFEILTLLTIVQALLLKYRNGHNLAHKNRHLYFKAKAKTHWVQKQARIFKKQTVLLHSFLVNKILSIGNSHKSDSFYVLFVLELPTKLQRILAL